MTTNINTWPTETEAKEIEQNAKKFNATAVDLNYKWHKATFGNNVAVHFILRPFSCHFSVNSNNQFTKDSNKETAHQLKENIDNAMKFVDYLEGKFNNTKEM